jgi:hypothetical protein
MSTPHYRKLAKVWFVSSLALAASWGSWGQSLWNSVIVGGFDTNRSGNASFPSGASFAQARSAVATNLPNTVFTSFSTLDPTNLVGLDVVVIGVGTDPLSVTTPLSTSEQAALLQFVKRGGAAVLFTDNDSASINSTALNRSFLNPFGMSSSGTLTGFVPAGVPAPGASPLTSGPFGQVTTVAQYYPGCITNLGPYGTAVATNSGGCGIAQIRAGAINPGSGPVIVSSDISGFWDFDGLFPSNAALFLNALRCCEQNPQHRLLRIQQGGTNIVLHWPAITTNVVLEGVVLKGGTSTWMPITNVPSVIGAENYLTNPILDSHLYRLRNAQ